MGNVILSLFLNKIKQNMNTKSIKIKVINTLINLCEI